MKFHKNDLSRSKQKKTFQCHSSNEGFTLLEVIIALAILASSMMVLTSSWNGNFRRVRTAKLKTQAVHLLQKKMTEIEVLYGNDVKRLPDGVQKGVFKDPNLKRYSWEWESGEFKMPDIGRLFTQDEGTVDEMSLKVINKMKKYLEASIREVKVTLIYKASSKAKAQKFSIATILVDYDTPLDLGLGGLGSASGDGGSN